MKATTTLRSYRVLDYPFRIRSEIPWVGDALDTLLEPFKVEHTWPPTYRLVSSRRGLLTYRGGQKVATSDTEASLLIRLMWEINQEAIQRTTNSVLVHAAAASCEGQGIVLPAAMESGKTTLVAALIRAGFRYLTDEAAAFELGTGVLQPYPKPLSVDPQTFNVIPDLWDALTPGFEDKAWTQYLIRADSIRPGAFGGPCPVRYVISPKYSPGLSTSLERVSRAAGLVMLLENNFNLTALGQQAVGTLKEVVKNSECFLLRVGDLPTAVEAISEVVSS
jgi:hypothetical protein